MFNFLCFIKDGETTALLTDGGYNVTFRASERRSLVLCHVTVGEEHMRLSACRHTHNEKHVGAWANDVIAYND